MFDCVDEIQNRREGGQENCKVAMNKENRQGRQSEIFLVASCFFTEATFLSATPASKSFICRRSANWAGNRGCGSSSKETLLILKNKAFLVSRQ